MHSFSKVLVALEKMHDKLVTVPEDQQKKLYKTLDIDFKTKVAMFNLNARLFAMQKIDLEMSNFIYTKLKDYENTTLSQRIIIIQLMKELESVK